MFLVIDNYDSFVHNLARYFEMADVETLIVRNDALCLNDIYNLRPSALILSPGPCTPAEAGICVEAVRNLGHIIPILGVCLGHQCIGEAYGARTLRAPSPVHGKASHLTHDDTGVFTGLPPDFMVGRYHSLIVDPPDHTELEINARTQNSEIMGLRHSIYPVHGVQFHPESILTEHGPALIKNFIELTTLWHNQKQDTAA
ncbi:MAG: aminodeoxychorismate/anthranilate synthase component II [Alphaproteobacteria bacterium]|nr:aminodeoxychorismate/anthranilate synthase component II [Alphaproteobacteria bacterium]